MVVVLRLVLKTNIEDCAQTLWWFMLPLIPVSLHWQKTGEVMVVLELVLVADSEVCGLTLWWFMSVLISASLELVPDGAAIANNETV